MNDLRNLDWQASKTSSDTRQQSSSGVNYNPIYQRQNNPFSIGSKDGIPRGGDLGGPARQAPSSTIPVRQALPSISQDSFGGLVDFGGPKKADLSKMSLAQQAASLQTQKAMQAQQSNAHFSDAAFFEAQLSRPSSTRPTAATTSQDIFSFGQLKKSDTETSEDIMAQINGDRPVDKSSFYPPPASPSREVLSSSFTFDMMTADLPNPQVVQADPTRTQGEAEEDDILGILGKPVAHLAKVQGLHQTKNDAKIYSSPARSFTTSSDDSSDDDDLRQAKAESLRNNSLAPVKPAADPQAALIDQLKDMGYTERQAQVALAQTETGLDLSAAIDLLLSLENLGNATTTGHTTSGRRADPPQQAISPRKQKSRTTESEDWVDSTYDLASKTLASANNWFSNKSALARRKLAEFNAENAAATHAGRFDERPKWMRDAERYERKEKGKGRAREEEEEIVREEGLPMHPAERRRLEMNGVLPTSPRRGSVDSQKSAKSISGSIRSIPETLRSIGTTVATGPNQGTTSINAARISVQPDSRRFKADDDEAATFVSSRRRRPAPEAAQRTASSPPRPQDRYDTMPQEDDLFGNSSQSSVKDKGKGKGKAPITEFEDDLYSSHRGKKASREEEADLFSAPKKVLSVNNSSGVPASTRKLVRQVPYLDATILATSSQQRIRGSECFKKGDFAKALSCYQTSLEGIPDMHPVRILSLTNRAITQIQLGAPKPAVEDCDEALRIIGMTRGQGEIVEDSGKQTAMTALWVKAMTRKATALEMQERISDALAVWQELVRSALGDSTAMQSRQRCENLLAPKTKPAPVKARVATNAVSQASQAAVRKLREEDAKIAQTEAEKDSLYAVVNDRITTWSAGKESNLRALLSSLDQVLWADSGWKKVSLADLVINAKVKVIYMKALAKVHPDKIARTASVEEKMIAAGVFSKLNAAWDSFKAQNNM